MIRTCHDFITENYERPTNLRTKIQIWFIIIILHTLLVFKEGRENPNYKGGEYIDTVGYVLVLCKDHPRQTKPNYVYEHIIVMEKKLGRYLKSNEIIHHKNGIKTDNRIENLELMTQSQHARLHHKKDMSQRKCMNCDSNETYMNKNGWASWHYRDDNWFCRNCFERLFPRKS